MNSFVQEFIALDVPPLLAAISTSVACALVGNFLVLRRMSMLGDTISHAVLPGIVLGFIISGVRETIPMLVGALIAGFVASALVQILRTAARLEPGAALGVVLTIFFALGIFLLEQSAARGVDLDASCVLYGQLEGIFWEAPPTLASLFSPVYLATNLPREVHSAIVALVISGLFVILLRKELAIATFDPGLAYALNFSPFLIQQLLMAVVALTVVASFEVVGSILVTSMLVCPAAAARLLTDRLNKQLVVSVVFAFSIAVLGYLVAAFGGSFIGIGGSVNAAGTIGLGGGILVLAAFILGPRHGLLANLTKHARLKERIRQEDILGVLLRCEELGTPASKELLVTALGRPWSLWRSIVSLRRRGLIQEENGSLALTSRGRKLAQRVIRTHRLWEIYLVDRLGLRPDHVHLTAEQLEHFTEAGLETKLSGSFEGRLVDPHGKELPEKKE